MFWSEKSRKNIVHGAFATARQDLLATCLQVVYLAAKNYGYDASPIKYFEFGSAKRHDMDFVQNARATAPRCCTTSCGHQTCRSRSRCGEGNVCS
jgi:hypothetical protein